MTLTDGLVIIAVFGGFGFLIWSSLVKKNHPIVDKVKQWVSKPKEKLDSFKDDPNYQQPNIERKIY